MTFQRWKLETFDQSESYTFPINPNVMSSPIPAQSLTYNWAGDLRSRLYGVGGGTQTVMTHSFVGTRAPRAPVQWSFGGVLYDEAHYAAMVEWIGKGKVRLTTDLGEILQVRLTAFQPERKSPQRPRHPFRHHYTVKALVYFYNYGQV